MSFQQTNLVTAPEWVGLENFRTVLEDPRFWTSVRNTAYFTLLALVFGYPLPLVLAVLMSELRRGKAAFSVLAYLPVVIPPVVAVLLWRFFYDASPTGVFNTMLGWVNLGPYPWIQDTGSGPCRRSSCRRRGPTPGRPSSSTWPRSPASGPSCTTPPRSTAPACGARSGTSRCRRCGTSC